MRKLIALAFMMIFIFRQIGCYSHLAKVADVKSNLDTKLNSIDLTIISQSSFICAIAHLN